MSRQMTGFRAWVWQRISAVYLGIFIPVALLYLLLNPPASHADWLITVANPGIFISLVLFTLAALIHVWIGMRDIVIDYVKPDSLRMVVLALLGLLLIVCGCWMAMILVSAINTIGG